MDALTSFGPAGAAVVIVALFLKFIHDESVSRNKREEHFAKTIDSNTKATKQIYEYLRSLNGELKRVARKKLENK